MGIIIKNICPAQLIQGILSENDPKSYAIYLLANFCMPTLLNRKPSSLVRADKRKIKDGAGFLKELEKQLEPFFCGFMVLSEDGSMQLLLIYHRLRLKETLACYENKQFLEALGYNPGNEVTDSVLRQLKERYEAYRFRRGAAGISGNSPLEYPHEVGVLLGYPLWDVKDFIRYSGANYIICGYWKVYHDAENALRIFDCYRQIRENSLQIILAGKELRDMKDTEY